MPGLYCLFKASTMTNARPFFVQQYQFFTIRSLSLVFNKPTNSGPAIYLLFDTQYTSAFDLTK